MARKKTTYKSGDLPQAPSPSEVLAGHSQPWSDINQEVEGRTDSLGAILLTARQKKDWTRAQLAYQADVNASSIARYEKIGFDDEVKQFPPADKLARLCLALDLNPSTVLISVLPDEMKTEGHVAFTNDVQQPMYEFAKEQYSELLHENHVFRTLFARLFGPKPANDTEEYEKLLWLIGAAKELFSSQTKFENKMSSIGRFVPMAREYNDPMSPEFVVKDWIYEGNPGLDLVDGSTIAELIGWGQPEQSEEAFREALKGDEASNHIFSVSSEKLARKRSPEDDLPSPPNSTSASDQISNKEVDDEQSRE